MSAIAFSPFPDRPVNVLPELLGSGRVDVFDAVAAAAVFKVAGGREFAIGAGTVLLAARPRVGVDVAARQLAHHAAQLLLNV